MSIVVNKTRLPVTQWQTESGSVVSISDARKRYAKSLSVALEPIQDLHGYANPWVGGAGKNKCSMADQTFVQYLEVEIDEIPAGTYNYSAVVTSSDTDDTKCAIVFLDADKNTLSAKSLSRSVGGSRISTEFTVSSPLKYLRLYASSGWTSGAGDTASFADNMICLASATDPTVYAPYENICPISGTSSVTAYDDPKYGGKIWWNQLTKIPSSDKTDTKFGVTITDNRNGSYTLNGTATAGFNFRIPDVTYTNGHVYLIHSHPDVCITNDMGYNTNKGSKLQVANASRLVLFSFYVANGFVFDNVTVFPFVCDLTQMFGAGNEPTLEQFLALFPKDYYPYNAGTETLVSAVNGDPCWNVSVSLGQTVYGGIVDLVSGVMRVAKKSVTFIGDNTYHWYTYDPDNYDSFCFAVDLPDKSKKKLTSICDKYKNVDASWGAGGDGKYCVFSDHTSLARLYFRPPYSWFGETVADWKTWLSNNPLQVCYELATPQTIQLSPNQIEMLMRNNTVWCDAGVVTLEYARIRQ